MTYYELQELIWVQVCSQKGNHHWHLLRHNIRITIFVIVESIQQVFINSRKHNYSIWDFLHTWGAVSITNWSRFSIFFTSSWWVDISVSAVWTKSKIRFHLILPSHWSHHPRLHHQPSCNSFPDALKSSTDFWEKATLRPGGTKFGKVLCVCNRRHTTDGSSAIMWQQCNNVTIMWQQCNSVTI